MATDALLQRLQREGLLKRAFVERMEEEAAASRHSRESDEDAGPTVGRRGPPPPHLQMLVWCDKGALEGGLTVALDVRADELIGPLCAAVGGGAMRLRVLDVREGPPMELRIGWGELEEPWEIEDLYGLVQNLNDLLRDDKTARAVAILGEWQDALQLWCVPKRGLARLLRQDFFAPRNRHQLEGLAS